MTVLSNRRSAPHECKQQEKQAGNLKPENMDDSANISSRNMTRVVEGPDPTTLAGPGPCDSEKCTALPAKTSDDKRASFLLLNTTVGQAIVSKHHFNSLNRTCQKQLQLQNLFAFICIQLVQTRVRRRKRASTVFPIVRRFSGRTKPLKAQVRLWISD